MLLAAVTAPPPAEEARDTDINSFVTSAATCSSSSSSSSGSQGACGEAVRAGRNGLVKVHQ